jgi:hypothetical protein
VSVIFPYRLEGVRVFDDAAAGLVREPFISGAGPDYSHEKVLTADIEPGEVAEGKFDLDVASHCARPDALRLEVNEKAGS